MNGMCGEIDAWELGIACAFGTRLRSIMNDMKHNIINKNNYILMFSDG